MATSMSVQTLTDLFKERIAELQEEPEFQLSADGRRYALSDRGEPDIRVAVGNVPLGYDLWKGLKNPAVIGSYPAGLREIWEFHANRKKATVDESGRRTIFQTPRSFDSALGHYDRAVLISVMLPFSPKVTENYAEIIRDNRRGSSHLFSRMYDDVNRMIDKATSRVAVDLVSGDAVVVAMSSDNVKGVSTEAIPLTRQGTSHGPCKDGNYSQKSLAALLGLGQFGVSRTVIRDEFVAGEVQRLAGPIRSIIAFDNDECIRDGSNGVLYPTEAWREFLLRLYDFTDIDPAINRYRFCTYIPHGDEGCTECIKDCPTGAQATSMPTPEGRYSAQLSNQDHRFSDGQLQFDFARCLIDRSQMATFFPEWSCARCLTSCAAQGKRRASSVEAFQQRMLELTKDRDGRSSDQRVTLSPGAGGSRTSPSDLP